MNQTSKQRKATATPLFPLQTGQVITRFGAEVLVNSASHGQVRCTARRKFDHIACGDQVEWQPQAQGNAAITAILPRRNVLERPDFRGRLRPIAANIDLLVIVASWQPAPAWELLDRYLIAAKRLDASVLLVMNKADLHSSHATAHDQACLQELVQAGYRVLHLSARQGTGLAELHVALQQHTAIVVGQSGVGKSSIAAQLLPQADIRIGAIATTGEGRHTTTSATLYHLPAGGALIDSPGVRDFGLSGLDSNALEAGFPEFAPYLGQCHFHNCTHHHEPGCAIKNAVSAGMLPAARYARYLRLREGLASP